MSLFVMMNDMEPSRWQALGPFLREYWPVLLPPLIGFLAVYTALPQARRSKPLYGSLLGAAALILGAFFLISGGAIWQERILFYAFSGIAVLGGAMMVTQANPVHAALSFALVVLSTCGLFLLQAAPFLMAATLIIYAGAIVVTFLFVIMLAQQEGPSNADQRTREPFLSAVAGFVLMAALLCVLHRTYDTGRHDSVITSLEQLSQAENIDAVNKVLGDYKTLPDGMKMPELIEKLSDYFPVVVGEQEDSKGSRAKKDAAARRQIGFLRDNWMKRRSEEVKKNAAELMVAMREHRSGHGSLALDDVPGQVNTPGKLPAENVKALGRTLFILYLVPVELAALLLLVATIGAIAIAGRRSEELR
jgi:NADH-quinone oxidoreductase subunit J